MKILTFPYKMQKPINSYNGVGIYRLREDKVPKGDKDDILLIDTEEHGVCFIRLESVWKAPVYEQVFKIPNKPMKLRQVVLRPISKEQAERIEFDTRYDEDEDFIRSLTK